MRDTYQEVLYNVTGQSLIFDVLEGRPSSVTSITVWRSENDDSGQTETAVGSGTIDSVNTTISAVAGAQAPDQTAITLTSGTGVIKDRAYLITNAGGQYEWVEVASISGTAVISRLPLLNVYAAGATFQSTRITAAFLDAWVQSQNNITGENGVVWRNSPPGDQDEEPWWRAAIVYVVGGVTYKREIRFDLVRYSSQHAITPIDMDRTFPGWLDQIPLDYRRDQGRQIIDEAFRALRNDLLAEGHTARWIRRQDVIGELLIHRAQWKAVETSVIHGAAAGDALKAAQDAYERRYNQLIREPHVRIGASSGGAIIAGRDRSGIRRH